MNKSASGEFTEASLRKMFWRWLALSVAAMVVAAALPAMSADVFLDEGDGDNATPVTSPKPLIFKQPDVSKKPASESGAIAQTDAGAEIDSSVDQLEPPVLDNPPASVPAAGVTEPSPVEKPAVSMKHKSDKKKDHKKKMKEKKKDKKKKADKKHGKMKAAKHKVAKAEKIAKKAKIAKASSKKKGRNVASEKVAGKFFGGKYATLAKNCPMESTPGASDAVGQAKASRKLWVEKSGNKGYYKVYGKSGNAAFISKDCF